MGKKKHLNVIEFKPGEDDQNRLRELVELAAGGIESAKATSGVVILIGQETWVGYSSRSRSDRERLLGVITAFGNTIAHDLNDEDDWASGIEEDDS